MQEWKFPLNNMPELMIICINIYNYNADIHHNIANKIYFPFFICKLKTFVYLLPII